MAENQPITTAVYGGKRGGKKPRKAEPRRAERLVSRLIGDEAVAALYDGLGMKRPEQRRRRGRS